MEMLLLALISAAIGTEAVLMLVMAGALLRKPAAEAAPQVQDLQLPPLSDQLLQEWLYGNEEDKK